MKKQMDYTLQLSDTKQQVTFKYQPEIYCKLYSFYPYPSLKIKYMSHFPTIRSIIFIKWDIIKYQWFYSAILETNLKNIWNYSTDTMLGTGKVILTFITTLRIRFYFFCFAEAQRGCKFHSILCLAVFVISHTTFGKWEINFPYE